MPGDEKRKNPRVDSQNLLAYVCFDAKGQRKGQGMGRTLNVSEGGILLETHLQLETRGSVSLTIGLEEEIMEIRGKVTYSYKREDGRFESGIEFDPLTEASRRFLRQFVVVFKGE